MNIGFNSFPGFSAVRFTQTASRIAIISAVIWLAGCASQPEVKAPAEPPPPVTEKPAITIEDTSGQLTEVQTEMLRKYISLSEQNEGPLRQQYMFEMAQWLYEQLELKAALNAVDKIKTELLNDEQAVNVLILRARILLSMGENRDVLAMLPDSISQFQRSQQLAIKDIQAQAYLGAGFPFESVRTRVRLNSLLRTQLELDDNNYAIWSSINLMSLNTLRQINTLPLDIILKGWVDLAIATKLSQNNWQHLDQAYLDWATAYPNHPASGAFLASLPKLQSELLGQPKHIALLLPITGKLSAPARALRDGFLSAYYDNPDNKQQTQISVIDIDNNPENIWHYYQLAIEKGADFVVGPLNKASIDTLSQARELQVPVLTLNYAEQQTAVTDNLFQFGLLPEDEARQAAEIAIRQGKKHAAILTPNSPWGQRLQAAFQQRFEEMGGEVRSIKTYFTRRNDFSHSIKDLLNLTQSNRRYRELRKTIGHSVKFEPYRRHDIDMIFIAGTPRAARSIMPQLRFHQAIDLPVYSTSHVFSGKVDPRADSDMNNLIYSDMPWTLSHYDLKDKISKLWPESSGKYMRLYGLGIDAYNVIPYLARLKARSHERFNGYTGNLYMDPLLRIHRELIWANFVKGKPQPLEIGMTSVLYSENTNDKDNTETDN